MERIGQAEGGVAGRVRGPGESAADVEPATTPSRSDRSGRLEDEVVACGVRDEAAAAKVAELGCDFMQADFWGPPVDAEEFVVRFAG